MTPANRSRATEPVRAPHGWDGRLREQGREGAMKRLAVVIFACALALGLAAPAARVEAAYSPDDQSQAIVGLINDYRSSLGLQPVSLADDLGEAAQHHSDDMATNNYFSHTLSD